MHLNTLKSNKTNFQFNNPEDIHDFPITYNDLYMTLRHSSSYLHIKRI